MDNVVTLAQIRMVTGVGKNPTKIHHVETLTGLACGRSPHSVASKKTLLDWLVEPKAQGNCKRCAGSKMVARLLDEHSIELDALRQARRKDLDKTRKESVSKIEAAKIEASKIAQKLAEDNKVLEFFPKMLEDMLILSVKTEDQSLSDSIHAIVLQAAK